MKNLLLAGMFLFLSFTLAAQNIYNTDVEVSRFDFGQMWTFEHAPKDYLKNTYNFNAGEEWFDKTRISAVQFANFCSASFISPEGLILTNHHCSRGEVGQVMQEGENFDEEGFYAATRSEERRVEGLYVRQLRMIADITDFVEDFTKKAETDEERMGLRQEAFSAAKEKYRDMDGWKGLELEVATYYNGGKFSLYGHKRYDDIRLVLIPELQIGYFGGDADNFTYPRYNLDFTLWRAYEDGKPVNSSEFYFPVNAEGPAEGELIFAVGYPGSTERYRTMAQLEYDRDYRYKVLVKWLRDRIQIWQEKYDANPDPNLLEQIFNFSNGEKSFAGTLAGLNDPTLMGKKYKLEQEIKAKSPMVKNGEDPWEEMAEIYTQLSPYNPEQTLLSPSPFNGQIIGLAHQVYGYVQGRAGGSTTEELAGKLNQIKETASALEDPEQMKYFKAVLNELKLFQDSGDTYVDIILDGRSPDVAAEEIVGKTKFTKEKKLEKILTGKQEKLMDSKDPFIQFSMTAIPEFREAVMAIQAKSGTIQVLQGKISKSIFDIYGISIPPDASSTLRLSDGVAKDYEYNGTKAPVNTTFFGLYDRYYSHDKTGYWALPEKWLNPPMEMLNEPLNFVSTCDITGGSSGSPIINTKGELIGLAFDGNIESLPGNFIFDKEVNRTVGVHAGGLVAGLKYIYKADRILKEMSK